MYKTEPWYKLWGGCILVQIVPLQDFGTEMGGGGSVYSGVGLYSKYYGTFMDQTGSDLAQFQ